MARIHVPVHIRTDQAVRRRKAEAFRRSALRIRWPSEPEGGWLAETRVVSGIATREIASRLGVDQSVVVRAEASERKKSITLAALERYADALDADLRYFIVPRSGLLERVDSVGRPRRHQMRVRAPRNRSAVADM
jgi:transcriptional regulator with XRE-family HTH domain